MALPADGATVSGRVLYVITDLEVGGVPLHVLRLATVVRERGLDVAVVSLKPAGAVGDRLRDSGIEVFSCAAQRPWDWRAIERLAGLIADFAPDLVHALLFHANIAARFAGLLGGFPRSRLICEVQTVEIERTWHLWVDRLTHRLCRVTVGNSPSVIAHLHNRAGIPHDRLRCIPGGVDVLRIAATQAFSRTDLDVAVDEALLLWVGRMDPIKGLDTLVAAVDLLRRERRVCLLLVGDGPERARVEGDVAARGLADCVRLLGRREDVPRLLKSADLFVFPSRTEGFPNAVLEAMAAGLPVVATDVPGTRDLVRSGENGLLVRPDDATALANALARMLGDRALATVMAERAQCGVRADYTLKRCHGRYFSLYDEVLR